MISLKRSTLVFMLLMSVVIGAGLGTWGAGAVDVPPGPSRAAVPPLAAPGAHRACPALPVPSGSFAAGRRAVGRPWSTSTP